MIDSILELRARIYELVNILGFKQIFATEDVFQVDDVDLGFLLDSREGPVLVIESDRPIYDTSLIFIDVRKVKEILG